MLATCVLVVAATAPAVVAQQPVPRQVAAPPEDLTSGLLRLPDPADLAVTSRSAWLRLAFERAPDGGWAASVEVPVPEAGALALVPLGPGGEAWTLGLADPTGRVVDLAAAAAAGRARRVEDSLDALAPGAPAVGWVLEDAAAGTWRVGVRAPAGRRAPEGVLLVRAPGGPVLESRLTTVATVAGDPIGVVARAPTPVAVLELRAVTPDGDLVLPMHDDGRHADGAPGDGLFGAVLPPLGRGRVLAQVVGRGLDADGRAWLRTTEHVFPVVERAARLTGEVETLVLDERRLGLHVGAWVLADDPALQLSAEVWGTTSNGALVPVCWLSTMVTPDAAGGASRLALALDVRWLDRVGASAPLELRRLRLQDRDTSVPIDGRERVRIETFAAPASLGSPPSPVVRDMTMGPSPLDLGAQPSGAATRAVGQPAPFTRALVLSHGYCSSGAIWPLGDFTGNVLEFVDPDQNRSHDEFAQLLGAFGAQVDSFGLVAHSQGGAAGLHLYTYYTSGLDRAKGGRLIQAVATPWQGSPLASSLAGLGGIFGIGCGSNDDLSDAGAALWLAGIPSWARAEVTYWTTQNDGSACNSLTAFFLDSPNDGVVEMAKGQLPGGTNAGHVVGWCHTTGMSDPANYLDGPRNMERDAAAAR